MTANQILQAVGPDLQSEILTYFQNEQRPAYRAVIQNLATARKLRPVFIQSKSKAQQAAWLLEQLRLRNNEDVTAQILQIWLLKGQSAMLVSFLDAAGIPHNGEGEVEELPEDIDEEKAQAGINALTASYPEKQVALYLHMFQMQKPEGFSGISKILESNPNLQLNAA
jgi:hypothetical protein